MATAKPKKPKAKPTKRGRPTKIKDPVVLKALETAIKMGAPISTACNFAGITRDTYYEWLHRGAEETEGIYKEFSDTVKRWDSEGELGMLGMIRKAAKAGQWTASAWILERTKQKKYGKNQIAKEQTNKPILWKVDDGS